MLLTSPLSGMTVNNQTSVKNVAVFLIANPLNIFIEIIKCCKIYK